METLSSAACHGGRQSFHSHTSTSTGTTMKFGVFTPPGAGPFPMLWCLAGLTCTEETFAIKAGAQALAAGRRTAAARDPLSNPGLLPAVGGH